MDEWQRMLNGEDCSMCRDGGLPTNPFSDLIAETPSSYVRLCVNQSQPGYCVVISKRHVPELHDLSRPNGASSLMTSVVNRVRDR